jgi:transcriptional regulator with XRE-family HTH domain
MFQRKFNRAWLRYLIDMRGMTLTEVARRMGVSLQTVSNFMVGRREPSDVMLGRMFAALGMTLTEATAAWAELYDIIEVDND